MTRTFNPKHRIVIEGQDIRKFLDDDVVSLSFEDHIEEADAVSFEITNRKNQWIDHALFDRGNAVDLYLGYGPQPPKLFEGVIAVVGAMGVKDAGIFGDILCARMAKRKVTALVSDGVVRDAACVLSGRSGRDARAAGRLAGSASVHGGRPRTPPEWPMASKGALGLGREPTA